MPAPRDPPARNPAEAAKFGLQWAQVAQNRGLAKAQRERAKNMAEAAPEQFELDRHGALAIRGEVLAAGIDAERQKLIEDAGFEFLRRSEIPELGLVLSVFRSEQMSARQALKRLRRIDPDGVYELNHAFFESGYLPGNSSPQIAPPLPVMVTSAAAPIGTLVGLIDTGVADRVGASKRISLVTRNFGPGEGRPAFHGTAVATLLASEPGQVTIYAADIFGSQPSNGTSERLIKSLGWMASRQVPVINISIVGPANGLVGVATAELLRQGFIIVAPVGNDGRAAKPLYPASYPGVIAVSAANDSGQLLPEASRVKRVDFVGPGIASIPGLSGEARTARGTSFAAPIIARLLADQLRTPNPLAAKRAIAQLAQQAVQPKASRKWYGYGLVGMEATGAIAR